MNSHGEFDIRTLSTMKVSYPLWATKTIEVVGIDVGNLNYSRKTWG